MQYKNGAYKAKCIKHNMIGEEGSERYAMVFQLLDGPDAGKNITFYGGFAGGGTEFTMKVIETCGFDSSKESDFTSAKLDKEVMVTLIDKTYTNKSGQTVTATEVKYVNPIDSAPVFKNALPPAKAKDIAAAMTARYKATKNAGAAEPEPRAVTKDAKPVDDSDIPF